ncbi:inorganic diphosphatase, partial [Propionimicrobium lymphophilum]
VECRAIAMFQMQDEMGGDDKVLCIPTADSRRDYMDDLDDIPEFMLLEIEHFFTVYKDLEPGKSVEGATWVGRAEAEKEVLASLERAKGTPYEHMSI